MDMTRRRFLRSIGAAGAATMQIAGFPAILKRRKPNEMLSHVAIGCANQAAEDLRDIASHKDVNITAICDVDSNFLAAAHNHYPHAKHRRSRSPHPFRRRSRCRYPLWLGPEHR